MNSKAKIQVTENSAVEVVVQSPRLLHINKYSPDCEILDENGDIVELDYREGISFKVGGYIDVKKHRYKIHKIQAMTISEPHYYQVSTSTPLTIAYNFILPFLGQDRNYFRVGKYFVNAYLGTEYLGDYGDKLYLLYRFDGGTDFIGFEEKMINLPTYEGHTDIDDFQVLYCFGIPEQYTGDVSLILKGKYSHIRTASKHRILNFHHASEDRLLGQILSKSKMRKAKLEKELLVSIPEELDLYPPPVPAKEMFLNELALDDMKTLEKYKQSIDGSKDETMVH